MRERGEEGNVLSQSLYPVTVPPSPPPLPPNYVQLGRCPEKEKGSTTNPDSKDEQSALLDLRPKKAMVSCKITLGTVSALSYE